MKWCTFCGNENRDEATRCSECATPEFSSSPASQSAPLEQTESVAAETILCTSCIHPNHPHTAFCKNCGAPLGIISTIGPFEQAFAEGFAYRRSVEGSPRLIILIGIWLIFLPGVAMVLISFPFSNTSKLHQLFNLRPRNPPAHRYSLPRNATFF
jgi:uncharacterized membrane protein YvbJ